MKSCLDFSFTNLLVKSSTSYFLLVQRYFSYMINQLNFLLIFNQVKQIKAEIVFTLKVHYVFGVFNTHLALKTYMVGHFVTLVNIIMKSCLDFSFTNLLVKSSTSYFLLVQRYFSYMINQLNFLLIFNQVKQIKRVFTLKVHYVLGVFNTKLALKTYMVGHSVALVNIIIKSRLDFSFTNIIFKSSTSYFLLVQRYFSYMINQQNFSLIFNQVKQIKVIPRIQQAEILFTLKVHYVLGVFNTHLALKTYMAEIVFTLKVHYVLGVFNTNHALKTYMVGHFVTLVNIIIKSCLDFSFTNPLVKSSPSYFLLVQRYFSYMINQLNFLLIFNQVKQIKVIPRIQQAEIVYTLKVHYVLGVFNTHLALKTYMVGHFVTLVNIIIKSCLDFSFTNLLVKSSPSYFLLVQRYFSYMINQLNFLLIFNQVKQIKVIPRIQQAEIVYTLKVHYVLGVFNTHLALKTYMVGHFVTLVNIIIKSCLDFSFTNLLVKSSPSYFLLVQIYFSYMINQLNFLLIFNQVKQIKVIPRIQQAEIVFSLKVHYVLGVFNTNHALKTYMVGHFVTLVNIIIKSCLDFSFTNLLVKSSPSYFLLVQRYFSYMINQLNFLLIFNQVKQIKVIPRIQQAEIVYTLKVHYVLGVFNTHLALKTYMVGHFVTLVNIIIKSCLDFSFTNLLVKSSPSYFLLVQRYFSYMINQLNFLLIFNQVKQIKVIPRIQQAERVFTLKVHNVLGVFNTHLALKTYMVGHFVTLVNIIIKSCLDFSFTNLLVKTSTSYFLLVQIYFSYMINQLNFLLIFNQVKQIKVIPRIQQAERVFTLKVHYVLGVFNTHLALKTYMAERVFTLKVHYILGVFNTHLTLKTYMVGHSVTLRYFWYMINQQNFLLIFNQVKQIKVIPRIQQAERVFTLKVHYVLGVFNTHLALKTYMRYFSYMINQQNFLLIFNQVKKIKVIPRIQQAERVFTLKVHYVLGVFNTHLALKTYMRYSSYMINQQNFLLIFNQVKQIKVIPRIQQAERVFTLKVHYVLGVFNTHLALKTYMAERVFTLKVHYVVGVFNTHLALKTYMVGHFVTLAERVFTLKMHYVLGIFNTHLASKTFLEERVFTLKVHYVLGVFNTHLASKTNLELHFTISSCSEINLVHVSLSGAPLYNVLVFRDTSGSWMKEDRVFTLKVHHVLGVFNTNLASKTYLEERVFNFKVHYVLGVFNTHLASKIYLELHFTISSCSEILLVHGISTKHVNDIQPGQEDRVFTLKVHYFLGVFNTNLASKTYSELHFTISSCTEIHLVHERVFTLKVHYVLGVFNTHLALKTYMVGNFVTLVNIIIKSCSETLFVHDQSTKLLIDIQPSKADQRAKKEKFKVSLDLAIVEIVAERVFTLKVHYVLVVFDTHLALKTYMVGHFVTLVNIIIKSCSEIFSYMINQQNFLLIFNQVKQIKAERVFTLKVHYVLVVFDTHLALKTYMVGHFVTLVNIIIKSCSEIFSYMINQQNFLLIFNQVKQIKVIPHIQQVKEPKRKNSRDIFVHDQSTKLLIDIQPSKADQKRVFTLKVHYVLGVFNTHLALKTYMVGHSVTLAERVFTLKVHYVLGIFNTHLALKTYMVGHFVTLDNIIIKSRLDFSFTNLLVKSSTSYFLLVQRYFSYMINQQNFLLIFNQVKQIKVIPRIQQAESVFTLKVHYVLGIFNTHLALKTYMVGHFVTLDNIIIKSRLDFSFTNLLVKSSTSYFLLVQRYFSYMINQQNFLLIFNQVKQIKVIPRIQQAESVFTLKVHYVLGIFNTHLALKTYMVGHFVTLDNIIIKSRLDFSFTNLLVKSSTSYFLLVQRYFSYMINQQNLLLIFNQVKQIKVIPRIQQVERVFTLKVHYVLGVFNTHLALKTYMVGHFVTAERVFTLKVHYVLGVFNTHLALKTYMAERVFTLKVHYVFGVFNTHHSLKTYIVGHFVTLVNIMIKSHLDFSFTNLLVQSSTSYFLLVHRYLSYMINQQNFLLIFNQVKQIKAERVFTLKVHYVFGVFNTHLALKTYMVGHFVTLVNIIITSRLDFSFTYLLVKISTSYFLLVQRYFSYMFNQQNFLLIFNQVKQIKAERVFTLKVHYVFGVFNTHHSLKTYIVGHFVTLVNIMNKSHLDFSFTNLLVQSSTSYFLLVHIYLSYMINQQNFLLIFNQVKQIKAERVFTLKVHYVFGVFNTHHSLKTYIVGHFVTLVNIMIKSHLDFSFTNLLVQSSTSYFLLVHIYLSYMINQQNFLLIFNQVKQIKAERVFTLKVHYVFGVFNTHHSLKTYIVGHFVTLVNIMNKSHLDFSFTNLLVQSSTSYFLLVHIYLSYMINQQNFLLIFNQVKQIKAERVFTLKVHYVFGVFNTHHSLKTYIVGHFVTLVNIMIKSHLDFSFTNLLVQSSTSYFLLVHIYLSYMINQQNFLLIFNQVKQIKAERVFTLKVHYVFGVFNTHHSLKTYIVGHFVTLVNIMIKSHLDFSFTNLLVQSSTSYFLLVHIYLSYMINQQNFLLIFNQVKQIKAERVFTLKVHYVFGVFNTHHSLKTYIVGHFVTLVNIMIKSHLDFSFTNLLVQSSTSYFLLVHIYLSYMINQQNFLLIFNQVKQIKAERVFTLKVHYVFGVFNTHHSLKTYIVGHFVTLVNIMIKSHLDFSFTNLLVQSSTSYFLLVHIYLSYMINQQNFLLIFNQVKQIKAERVFTLKVHYVFGVFNTHLALKTYMVGHFVTLVNIIITSRLDFSFTYLLVKISTSYFLLVQRYFSYMFNQQNFLLIFNQVKQIKAERVFTLKVHYVLGVFNTHLSLKTYIVGHFVTLVNIMIKSHLDFSFTNLLVKSSTSYFLLVQRYFSYMINQQNFLLIFNHVKQIKAGRVFTLKVHYVLGVFNTHLSLKTYIVGHFVTLVNIMIKSHLDFSFTNLLVKSSISYFLLVQRYFSYMINQQNFLLIFNHVKQIKAERVFTLKVHYAERVFTLKVHYVLGVFNTHLSLKTYIVGHFVTLVNIMIKSHLDFSFTNLLVKSSTSYFLLVQRYFSYMINQQNFLLIFNHVKQIKAERVFTLKVHYVLGVFNTHLSLKTYIVGHFVTLVNIMIKSHLDFSFTNLLVKSSTSYFLLVQRYFSYMINQQNFLLIFNHVKQIK
ncbi:hypothetical protein RYX36_009151, partial [Vicia faba]